MLIVSIFLCKFSAISIVTYRWEKKPLDKGVISLLSTTED